MAVPRRYTQAEQCGCIIKEVAEQEDMLEMAVMLAMVAVLVQVGVVYLPNTTQPLDLVAAVAAAEWEEV
jgi:hypothetical protein